jgi:hypothetical protein
MEKRTPNEITKINDFDNYRKAFQEIVRRIWDFILPKVF